MDNRLVVARNHEGVGGPLMGSTSEHSGDGTVLCLDCDGDYIKLQL